VSFSHPQKQNEGQSIDAPKRPQLPTPATMYPTP
jgi:hypothetical protein